MLNRISPVILFIFAFALVSISASGQSTFQGNNLGLIPDSPDEESGCQVLGPPRDVTFNVTGFPSPPSNISIEMAFDPAHDWAGDLVATLISPDGTQFVIFGYTGISSEQGTFDGGDDSDLVGPYIFNDSATGNWWNVAEATDKSLPIPPGNYRTSAIEGFEATGTVTSLNAAFAGIPTSNGTWILRLTDGCAFSVGGISSANLTLTSGPASFPRQKPNVDMNGLGRSDFVITRGPSEFGFNLSEELGRPLSNRQRQRQDLDNSKSGRASLSSDFPMQWWTLYSENFGHIAATWGDVFDWITPADFDGDNKADIAIWRPDAEAEFFWINSSDITIGSSKLGMPGDNPSVVGDYDGDNKADPTVYRCPDVPGQCHFLYRGTKDNPEGNITELAFGFGDWLSVRPMPGDFDGDQKYDFCVYTAESEGSPQGMFLLQTSGSPGSVEPIYYGLVDDVLVPGDYDGDGRTDFGLARAQDGNWDFYVLERDGGGYPAAPIRWGFTQDYIVPGDYDGDGRTDVAIYRWGESGQNSTFWVLSLSDWQVNVYTWGLPGDVPPASWIVQ